MQPKVGDVLEGKVTSITKFGAFIALPDGKSGLVHISEIANAFVSDIHDHVNEGQTVKVKVIGINDAGKINLSMKQALSPIPHNNNVDSGFKVQTPRAATAPRKEANPATTEQSFEDKLKHFMQDSDSRISGSRLYTDRKSGYRRKRD